MFFFTKFYLEISWRYSNYLLDDFEINEIDEDMYTESNFEKISSKNSKKKTSLRKIVKNPL
jgi:hypothetical protein